VALPASMALSDSRHREECLGILLDPLRQRVRRSSPQSLDSQAALAQLAAIAGECSNGDEELASVGRDRVDDESLCRWQPDLLAAGRLDDDHLHLVADLGLDEDVAPVRPSRQVDRACRRNLGACYMDRYSSSDAAGDRQRRVGCGPGCP
jgi:hypothetical protein